MLMKELMEADVDVCSLLSNNQELSLYFDSSIYHSFCLNGLRSEMRDSREEQRWRHWDPLLPFFSRRKKSYHHSILSFSS